MLKYIESESNLEHLRGEVRVSMDPRYYYGQLVKDYLLPAHVVSLLRMPELDVAYVLGRGPKVGIFQIEEIRSKIVSKGLAKDCSGIVRRIKVEQLSSIFMPESFKFQPFTKCHIHWPVGLYDMLRQMKIDELKSPERQQVLRKYWNEYFSNNPDCNAGDWVYEIFALLQKSGHSTRQTIRAACATFFGKIQPTPMSPSKKKTRELYWNRIGSCATNIFFHPKQRGYVDLADQRDVRGIILAILGSTGGDHKFLLDINAIPSLIGEMSKPEIAIDVIFNVLQNGVDLIVYTSINTVPKTSVAGLYYSSVSTIDYSTMKGFYALTLDDSPVGPPVVVDGKEVKVIPYPSFLGRDFIAATYCKMFSYQEQVLAMLLSPEFETQERYDAILAGGDTTIFVGVSDNKSVRAVDDYGVIVPTIMNFDDYPYDPTYESASEEGEDSSGNVVSSEASELTDEHEPAFPINKADGGDWTA
jgi:hypothetical protein